MNIEELKFEIYTLTKDKSIFIENNNDELICWIGINNEMLYQCYMVMWFNNNITSIRNYSIKYAYRGTGLGSKLYDIFEKYLISNGCKEIQLHLVLTGAEKFWKKKGFSIQNHIWKKLLNI